MDEWDTEERQPVALDSWEDEFDAAEEDGSVKDNWEDSDEEEEEPPKPEPVKEKPKTKAENDKVEVDPIAEKLRMQKIVEEADFELSQDLFSDMKKGPTTMAECDSVAGVFSEKFKVYENNIMYIDIWRSFLNKVCESWRGDEVKELAQIANTIANEKFRKEKEKTKKKKASSKAQVRVDGGKDGGNDLFGDLDAVAQSGDVDNEFDFM